MLKLQEAVRDARDGRVVQIPEVAVMGSLSAEGIERRLESACSERGRRRVEGEGESIWD